MFQTPCSLYIRRNRSLSLSLSITSSSSVEKTVRICHGEGNPQIVSNRREVNISTQYYLRTFSNQSHTLCCRIHPSETQVKARAVLGKWQAHQFCFSIELMGIEPRQFWHDWRTRTCSSWKDSAHDPVSVVGLAPPHEAGVEEIKKAHRARDAPWQQIDWAVQMLVGVSESYPLVRHSILILWWFWKTWNLSRQHLFHLFGADQ